MAKRICVWAAERSKREFNLVATGWRGGRDELSSAVWELSRVVLLAETDRSRCGATDTRRQ